MRLPGSNTNLLQKLVNYGRKSFIILGPDVVKLRDFVLSAGRLNVIHQSVVMVNVVAATEREHMEFCCCFECSNYNFDYVSFFISIFE